MVATDLGGPDTYLPGPPRTRPTPTSPTLKSEEPLSTEQVEIADLRRQLEKAERRLVTTEAALVIMGKAHDLLDVLTKSSRDDSEHTTH